MTIEHEIEHYQNRVQRLLAIVRKANKKRAKTTASRVQGLMLELGYCTAHVDELKACVRAYQARYDAAMDDPTGQDLDAFLDESY